MYRKGIAITAGIGICSIVLAMSTADSENLFVPITLVAFGIMNVTISWAINKAAKELEERNRIIDMYRFN